LVSEKSKGGIGYWWKVVAGGANSGVLMVVGSEFEWVNDVLEGGRGVCSNIFWFR
jgi:hypothetical protein